MALIQLDFFSDVLGMNTSVNVILPQTSRGIIGVDGAGAEKSFPTMYLLHGLSDDHTTWGRRTNVELLAEMAGIAVVMPTTHRAWYTDEYRGMKYRTYIGEELPRVCRSFFRGMSDKREDNYVCGISMGGYGSLALALTYPETYSLCMPISAAYDPRWLVDGIGETPYFEQVFGPVNEFEGSENDLYAKAEALAKSGRPLPKIWTWCGSSDFLIDYNRKMRDLLTKLGYDFTYTESEGAHGWVHWNPLLPTVFKVVEEHRKSLEK